MTVKGMATRGALIAAISTMFSTVAVAEEWYIPKRAEILPEGRLEAGVRMQLSGNEDGIIDREELSFIPSVRYSFTPRFEMYAELPLSHASEDDIVGFSVVENSDSGIGDLFVQMTYEVAAASNWKVSASLDVTAPTGDDPYENEVGLGNGYWTVTPGVNFAYITDPAILFAYFGYQHGFDETFTSNGTKLDVEPNSSVRMRAGASFAFNPRMNMSMYTALDIRNETEVNGAEVSESDDTLARLGLSLGFKLDDDTSVGMNTALGLNDSTSDYVISFGLNHGF